jgi:hypothetical protein
MSSNNRGILAAQAAGSASPGGPGALARGAPRARSAPFVYVALTADLDVPRTAGQALTRP